MFTPSDFLDLNEDSVLLVASTLVDTKRNIRDAIEEQGWKPATEFYQAVEKLITRCSRCRTWTPIREGQAHEVCRACGKKAPQPPEYLTTEQLGEAMIETVEKMSPEEKAALRQQLTGCSGCGIETRSRNRLCDVCDSLYAALTRNSAACEYWKKVNADARREAQRIRNLITLGDEENA